MLSADTREGLMWYFWFTSNSAVLFPELEDTQWVSCSIPPGRSGHTLLLNSAHWGSWLYSVVPPATGNPGKEGAESVEPWEPSYWNQLTRSHAEMPHWLSGVMARIAAAPFISLTDGCIYSVMHKTGSAWYAISINKGWSIKLDGSFLQGVHKRHIDLGICTCCYKGIK